MGKTTKERFEEYVVRNRLFILGAGFSAEAKIPLTDELLKLAMEKMQAECSAIYERINSYAESCFCCDNVDYSKISFSDFCTFLEFIELREFGGGERWSDDGSREKLALRFYLAKTIAERTPRDNEIPEIYLRFARQLHEKDIVITFNWDCLLEVALTHIGKEYSYNFDQKKIKICKLHGSVNWIRNAPKVLGEAIEKNVLEWTPIGLANGMMPIDFYYSRWLIYFNDWKPFTGGLNQVKPFLVLPGYGKAFDVRALAVLWYKPEFAFSFTHDVYIIGMELSHDDFFVKSFFLNNLPYIDSFSGVKGREITIINPAEETEKNYAFILHNNSSRLLNEKFDIKHIEAMLEKLKA